MLQGCRGKILQHVLCIVCVENSLPTLRLLSIDQTSEPHTQCPDELYHCNSLRLLMQIPVHCPSLMKLFAEVCRPDTGPTGAKVAALRGWSLLVSTLPTYSLTTGFVETSFAALAALLYSEHVDTRAAAGEAIALLYDSAGLAQLEGDSGDSGRAESSGQL